MRLVGFRPRFRRHAGLQTGAASFNIAVAQAFVSVERRDISAHLASATDDLLIGSTAYRIHRDLYDSAGQRYPLEVDQSVLRGVQVQLPVDREVLFAWLGTESGNLDEVQKRIDRVIAQGILRIYRADSVEALLAGDTALVETELTVNLSSRRMSFSADHFSVFSLVGVKSASEIEDQPLNTQAGGSGAIDWRTLLMLLAVFGIRGRGRFGYRLSRR